MRIAIFTDTFPPEINGVATSCKTLETTLREHGHDVIVVTTNPFSKRVSYEDGIVRIPGLEIKSLYGYILARGNNRQAYRILRAFKPDIIHINTEYGIGLFGRKCARKFHVPFVYTYHTMWEDYAYYITKGAFDRLARSLVRGYIKSMIDKSDAFITPSNKTKDYMRRIGIDKYANVIPTGISFDKFFPENLNDNDVAKVRDKFDIGSDKFTLLSLGRVAKEKSIDFCVNGYKRFLEKYPNIPSQLVIVGDGPYLAELKEYVERSGVGDHTIFTGACAPEEVQNYYAVGDVFASASLSETQGLTYMEAMAAGKYVLARFDHNLLDVISEGKTGFFFESEEEFSEKLHEAYLLKQENKTEMLDQAIKNIDSYSIETFYKRIIGVYKNVLKKYW